MTARSMVKRLPLLKRRADVNATVISRLHTPSRHCTDSNSNTRERAKYLQRSRAGRPARKMQCLLNLLNACMQMPRKTLPSRVPRGRTVCVYVCAASGENAQGCFSSGTVPSFDVMCFFPRSLAWAKYMARSHCSSISLVSRVRALVSFHFFFVARARVCRAFGVGKMSRPTRVRGGSGGRPRSVPNA